MCVKSAQGICISEDYNFVVAVLAAVLTRFVVFFFFLFKLKDSSGRLNFLKLDHEIREAEVALCRFLYWTNF